MSPTITLPTYPEPGEPIPVHLIPASNEGAKWAQTVPPINDPAMDLVFVTPEMAKRWLKRRRAFKRNIRPGIVSKMVQDMLSGTFTLSPTMISFGFDREGNDGALHNGQHRLTAIVSASVRDPNFTGVWSWVGSHQPFTAVESADCGAARTFADLLKNRSYSHYAILAAVVRAMFRWDEHQTPAQMGPASAVARSSAHVREFPTFAKMSEYLIKNEEELKTAVAVAAELYHPSEAIIRTSALGCAYYIFARIDADCAAKYMRSFDVSNPRKVSQAIAVRQSLMSGYNKGVRYNQAEEIEFLILGWNSYVKGHTKVQSPKWSTNKAGKNYIKPDDYSRPAHPGPKPLFEDAA